MKGLEPLDLSTKLFLTEFDLLYNIPGLTLQDIRGPTATRDGLSAEEVRCWHAALKTQRELEKDQMNAAKNKGSGQIRRIG